jgi:hypothetical protein
MVLCSIISTRTTIYLVEVDNDTVCIAAREDEKERER